MISEKIPLTVRDVAALTGLCADIFQSTCPGVVVIDLFDEVTALRK